VIWSTFEDVRTSVPLGDGRMPTLREKYKVPHFDGKAEANAYFTELALTMPKGGKKLPGMAASDIGPCAYGILKRGPEFVGKTIGIAAEHLTGTLDPEPQTFAQWLSMNASRIPLS
jgi:hypothetical protein